MRDLGICAPVVPAGRTTVQLAAINHHHMQVKKEKHWYSLTISCGSGMETPQKNWLLLKTCWCRGVRSPAEGQREMLRDVSHFNPERFLTSMTFPRTT